MRQPRGPDVSSQLRRFPIVTMVQLAADMPVAGAAPPGNGPDFAAARYIDAWFSPMEPQGWTDSDAGRLTSLYVGQ